MNVPSHSASRCPAIDETGYKGEEELAFITELRNKLSFEPVDEKSMYQLRKLVDRRKKCFVTMLKLSGNDKNQDKIADKREEIRQIERFVDWAGFRIVDSASNLGPLNGSVIEPVKVP